MKSTSAGGLLSTGSSSAVCCNDRLVQVNFQHKLLLELLEFGGDVFYILYSLQIIKSYLKPHVSLLQSCITCSSEGVRNLCLPLEEI